MSDHSDEIRQIQDLVKSWDHDKDDDWPINRAILDAVVAVAPMLTTEDCVYTNSHTRHWCGNPRCRDS